MDFFYLFFIRNYGGIYFLCLLGLVWYGVRFFRARNILRSAVFGLERERGSDLQSSALAMLALVFIVAGITYYVNSFIAPTLPQELFLPPTLTPNPFNSVLASPTPINTQFDRTATPLPIPTVTLPGAFAQPTPPTPNPTQLAEGEITPETASPPLVTPSPNPFDCPQNVTISSPTNGQSVAGIVTIYGTVGGENFLLYSLEVLGPNTNFGWVSLLTQQPFDAVQNNILGTSNFSGWSSGSYQIRLSALDTSSRLIGSCQVQVQVR